MELDLRQLRLFVAVAEEAGLADAARRLRLSRPTLRARLRELEARLGVPLLEQRARLRVGSIAGAGDALFAPAVERFAERFPGVEVSLRRIDGVEALARGTVDVALGPLEEEDCGLLVVPLLHGTGRARRGRLTEHDPVAAVALRPAAEPHAAARAVVEGEAHRRHDHQEHRDRVARRAVCEARGTRRGTAGGPSRRRRR